MSRSRMILATVTSALAVLGMAAPWDPMYRPPVRTPLPLLTGQRDSAYTEELRLASNRPSAFVTWVAGVFYDHRRQEDYQDTTMTAGNPGGFVVDQHYQDVQTAVFAQGDFHLTSQWTATLGYRIAHINTDFHASLVGSAPLSANPTANPTTPRAAVSYQPNDENLLYASASKGYRIGGRNFRCPPGVRAPGLIQPATSRTGCGVMRLAQRISCSITVWRSIQASTTHCGLISSNSCRRLPAESIMSAIRGTQRSMALT